MAIPPSDGYALVDKLTGIIVAKGSAKAIRKLRKARPGTFIGQTLRPLGERFDTPR